MKTNSHLEIEESDNYDLSLFTPSEVLGKKIVDIYMHKDKQDGDELHIIMEDGKQIEIAADFAHIQTD